MQWFHRNVRRSTSQLIQSVVLLKLGMKKKRKDKTIKNLLQDLFETILDKYDEQLKTKTYLAGEQISVVDILLQIELHTILKMYRREIPDKYDSLITWYEQMEGNPILKDLNGEFDRIVDEWDLYDESTKSAGTGADAEDGTMTESFK